ncbi:MAG: fluoride efflux transporter CrcB [Solirubrobacterales bacterium]
MSRYLLIAGFGAAGAASRYAVDSRLSAITGGQFPWGTLTVNVVGAFLLGVLIAVTTERVLVDQNWRIGLGIGFLGSFTTFSTFAYESVRLAEDSAWLLTAANVAGMVTLGLFAAFAGLAVGRTI